MWYVFDKIISDDYIFVEKSSYPEWIYKQYVSGEEIVEPFEFILFNSEKGKLKGDIIGGINPFTIISDNLKVLLESIPGASLKFYPAKLQHSEVNETETVWLLQVLETLDVFDWANSDYKALVWDDNKDDFIPFDKTQSNMSDTKIFDTISLKKIYKLKLKDFPSIDSKIFKMKKRNSLIIVDEFIYNSIQKSSFNGLKLIAIENYREL